MANMELRSLLVALLHRFDIEPADGDRVNDYEVYVALRGSLYAQLQELNLGSVLFQ